MSIMISIILMTEKRKLSIIAGTKCYEAHRTHNVACERRACSRWIEHAQSNNCTAVAIINGPHTLNEIGEMFGVTRMRICQLEKKAHQKLRAGALFSRPTD